SADEESLRPHLAAQQRLEDHLAAVRRPGQERPARAVHRGRADREGRAWQRAAGLVPAVCRRGPWLPEEGQRRLLRGGRDPVLAAEPARLSEATPVADVPAFDAIGPGDFVCIAHRGAAALAPENTMAAYRAAYASGLRLLEQDVRLLADGALAVMHDETVERLTDGRGDVRAFDTAAYRALRVDAGRFPRFAQQAIAPTLLDEVLAEFRGRA